MNDEEAVALIVGGHTTGRLGTFDPRVSGDWLKKAESWSKAMGVCSRRLGRRKVAPALRGRRRGGPEETSGHNESGAPPTYDSSRPSVREQDPQSTPAALLEALSRVGTAIGPGGVWCIAKRLGRLL